MGQIHREKSRNPNHNNMNFKIKSSKYSRAYSLRFYGITDTRNDIIRALCFWRN